MERHRQPLGLLAEGFVKTVVVIISFLCIGCVLLYF